MAFLAPVAAAGSASFVGPSVLLASPSAIAGSVVANMSAASVLTGVGAALSVATTLEAGRQSAASARYNARLARQNATLARSKAAEDERRFRLRTRKHLGATRAAYASAGVTLEGTPTDILDESEYIAELDALTLRAGGEQSAAAYDAEARLNSMRGKSAKKGSYLSAASSLASGLLT